MSLIRVTVCGRATTAPNVRDVNGSPCTSFGIAADTGTKDAEGNWESIFLWVSAWGKRGESIAKHLKKGERVLVMGSFSQRLYKDKEGNTKVQNKITAHDFEYLGGGQAQAQAAETGESEPEDNDTLPF